MDTRKPDLNTGSGVGSLILAREKGDTAGGLTPARTKNGNASISKIDMLSLLQSDLFDLERMGIKARMMGKDGRLYFILAYDGHELNFRDGDIYLDCVNTRTA